MAEPDAFDPTHALDGWRPPARAALPDLALDTLLQRSAREETVPLVTRTESAGFDPTHLLDGWRPPAPAPLDLDLKSLLRGGTGPDPEKLARLKARGYEMLDVEDIELVEPAPAVVFAAPVVAAPVSAEPMAPPLAETDLEMPPLMEASESVEVAPAAGAQDDVDLPLPDEGVWPFFTEEAQVLDAGTAPKAEPVPFVEAGPLMAAEPELPAVVEPAEPAPVVVKAAQALPQPVEPEPLAVPEAAEEPEAPPPAVAEAPASELRPAEAELAVEDPEATKTPPAAVEPPPVLDFHAGPPEPPRSIDDIQLPSVAPPPAAVEAPVLDFRAEPPTEPDALSVIADIELPRVNPPPVMAEMPQLNIAALTPQTPELDPRLLAQWQAGAWTALARQIAAASEELTQTPAGLRVESRAPQWLCAIWPPQTQDAPLGRWPELVSLVAASTRADALQQLLTELPDQAPLWWAGLEADWDLVAELVLHQDSGLRPSEERALQELAEVERKARLARLSEGYALHGRVARRRA